MLHVHTHARFSQIMIFWLSKAFYKWGLKQVKFLKLRFLKGYFSTRVGYVFTSECFIYKLKYYLEYIFAPDATEIAVVYEIKYHVICKYEKCWILIFFITNFCPPKYLSPRLFYCWFIPNLKENVGPTNSEIHIAYQGFGQS